MTSFLRQLPKEDPENSNWHLWTICYNMIRAQELHPWTTTPWRHYDVSDVTTENEDSSTSSEETLDDIYIYIHIAIYDSKHEGVCNICIARD